ncbi:MAG TPA: hypothetical protein VGP79_04180 [Bryobacteraceae bacterium]|nr:hypothetical protein [Bryobacteraceae bacterium]
MAAPRTDDMEADAPNGSGRSKTIDHLPTEDNANVALFTAYKREDFRVRSSGGELGDYAEAFRTAATELAGEREVGDLWAYPIVFLYRHAIELILKDILVNHQAASGVRASKVLKRGHSLVEQVDDLLTVLKCYGLSPSRDVVCMIRSWNEFDSQSFKARYPCTKDGERNPLFEGKDFDLRSFKALCERCFEELSETRAEIQSHDYSAFLAAECRAVSES